MVFWSLSQIQLENNDLPKFRKTSSLKCVTKNVSLQVNSSHWYIKLNQYQTITSYAAATQLEASHWSVETDILYICPILLYLLPFQMNSFVPLFRMTFNSQLPKMFLKLLPHNFWISAVTAFKREDNEPVWRPLDHLKRDGIEYKVLRWFVWWG